MSGDDNPKFRRMPLTGQEPDTSDQQNYTLPAMPRPSDGAIRNALLEAVRGKTQQIAYRNYKNAIQEARDAEKAIGEYLHAKHQRDRVVRLLEDAEDTVHKADADDRETDRINASRERRRAEVEAEIEEMDLEERLARKRQEHERNMSKLTGAADTTPAANDDPDDLTPEEQSFLRELRGDAEARQRLKAIYEQERARVIDERGGEQNLTEDDHEELERLKRQADRLLDESGLN